MDKQFIICGAGFSGLLMGIELRKLGKSVLLIERREELNRPVCGEYLGPEGTILLEEMHPGLISEFVKIKGMRIYAPNQQEVDCWFPEPFIGKAINRLVVQTKLLHLYQDLGGDIHFGETLTTILDTSHGLEVVTTKGQYHCESFIGADGRTSSSAKALGIHVLSSKEKRVALHCYLPGKLESWEQGAMHILHDGCYIGINPIKKSEVNFSIVTTPKILKKFSSDHDYLNHMIAERKVLRREFSTITAETIIKKAYPITRPTGQITGKNFALIGDASGFVDPLTGEGLTTAIKTVQLLSLALKKYPETPARAFQEYAKARKSQFAEKERLNHFFQFLIKKRFICNLIARLLNCSKQWRTTFIGIIGNIYTPKVGLKKMIRGSL